MHQPRKHLSWIAISSYRDMPFRSVMVAFTKVAATILLMVFLTSCQPSTSVTLTDLFHAPISKGVFVGQIVHFENATSKDTALCLGSNGKCVANPQGPKDLQPPGLKIGTHQSQDVVFSNKGTFQVVSLSDTQVSITINVS